MEVCCWLLGGLGGFGWSAYNGSWLIAGAVLVLFVMAFGEVRSAFGRMMDEE